MATIDKAETPEAVFTPRYRAFILGTLLVTYAVNFIDRNILAILLPQIRDEFSLADWQLGMLGGIAFALFYSTLGLPIASWADRSNRVTIISIAVTVWSIMTALSGMATSFIMLLLARIGVGIGEAGATPPSHSIIGDLYTAEKRASAIAIYTMGTSIGGFLGLIIGGWVAEYYGWRTAFMVVGFPGVLLAIFIKLTLKDPPRGMSENRAQPKEPASIREVASLLWSRPTFRHLSMGAALAAIISYGNGLWLPSFITRSFGMSLGLVGTYLAIIGLFGGLIGVYLGGVLSDYLAKRDQRWWMWVPAAGALLGVPFAVVAYLTSNVWVSLVFLFIPGMMASTFPGPSYATTQRLVGLNMRATASAFVLFIVTMIGLGLGPFIIGLISDALTAQFGIEALRYSLLITLLFKVWSAVHFFLAGKTIANDLERAPD